MTIGVFQLVPVDRSNPPVQSDLASPPDVKAILQHSCYDCHSYETVWPWYGYLAPLSWWVAYDVREARDEMNFSTWKAYRADKRARLLQDLLEEIDEENMPPWEYVLFHPEARLSDAERESLHRWIGDAAD